MKRLALIACMAATTASAMIKETVAWPVTHAIDGDTIAVDPSWLPVGLTLTVRVNGVDTPEVPPRAQCAKEAKAGLAASAYTKRRIEAAKASNTPITFTNITHDKYGGRLLADVRIGGILLSEDLIKQNLARPYHGERKSSWCN